MRSTGLTLTREQAGEGVVVRVTGDLLTANVPELENACSGLSEVVLIDLANLRLADSNGVKALKALERKGAQLTGISPRLRLILHASS